MKPNVILNQFFLTQACGVCSQVTDRLHDEELEIGGGINDGALAGAETDLGYALGRGIKTVSSSHRITKKQKLELMKEALQGDPENGKEIDEDIDAMDDDSDDLRSKYSYISESRATSLSSYQIFTSEYGDTEHSQSVASKSICQEDIEQFWEDDFLRDEEEDRDMFEVKMHKMLTRFDSDFDTSLSELVKKFGLPVTDLDSDQVQYKIPGRPWSSEEIIQILLQQQAEWIIKRYNIRPEVAVNFFKTVKQVWMRYLYKISVIKFKNQKNTKNTEFSPACDIPTEDSFLVKYSEFYQLYLEASPGECGNLAIMKDDIVELLQAPPQFGFEHLSPEDSILRNHPFNPRLKRDRTTETRSKSVLLTDDHYCQILDLLVTIGKINLLKTYRTYESFKTMPRSKFEVIISIKSDKNSSEFGDFNQAEQSAMNEDLATMRFKKNILSRKHRKYMNTLVQMNCIKEMSLAKEATDVLPECLITEEWYEKLKRYREKKMSREEGENDDIEVNNSDDEKMSKCSKSEISLDFSNRPESTHECDESESCHGDSENRPAGKTGKQKTGKQNTSYTQTRNGINRELAHMCLTYFTCEFLKWWKFSTSIPKFASGFNPIITESDDPCIYRLAKTRQVAYIFTTQLAACFPLVFRNPDPKFELYKTAIEIVDVFYDSEEGEECFNFFNLSEQMSNDIKSWPDSRQFKMIFRESGFLEIFKTLNGSSTKTVNLLHCKNPEDFSKMELISSDAFTLFTRHQAFNIDGYPNQTKNIFFKDVAINTENSGVIFDKNVLKLSFQRSLEILLISCKLSEIDISAGELTRHSKSFRLPYIHPFRKLPQEIETVAEFIRYETDFSELCNEFENFGYPLSKNLFRFDRRDNGRGVCTNIFDGEVKSHKSDHQMYISVGNLDRGGVFNGRRLRHQMTSMCALLDLDLGMVFEEGAVFKMVLSEIRKLVVGLSLPGCFMKLSRKILRKVKNTTFLVNHTEICAAVVVLSCFKSYFGLDGATELDSDEIYDRGDNGGKNGGNQWLFKWLDFHVDRMLNKSNSFSFLIATGVFDFGNKNSNKKRSNAESEMKDFDLLDCFNKRQLVKNGNSEMKFTINSLFNEYLEPNVFNLKNIQRQDHIHQMADKSILRKHNFRFSTKQRSQLLSKLKPRELANGFYSLGHLNSCYSMHDLETDRVGLVKGEPISFSVVKDRSRDLTRGFDGKARFSATGLSLVNGSTKDDQNDYQNSTHKIGAIEDILANSYKNFKLGVCAPGVFNKDRIDDFSASFNTPVIKNWFEIRKYLPMTLRIIIGILADVCDSGKHWVDVSWFFHEIISLEQALFQDETELRDSGDIQFSCEYNRRIEIDADGEVADSETACDFRTSKIGEYKAHVFFEHFEENPKSQEENNKYSSRKSAIKKTICEREKHKNFPKLMSKVCPSSASQKLLTSISNSENFTEVLTASQQNLLRRLTSHE